MINDLEFASPESQGIRSEDILTFMERIAYHKINMHSFLMARKGKIIAEGYVPPFHEAFPHRLYSASKTYVALAIGLLITEGKITLQSRVVDYLQNYIESEQHPWVREMTVEDCLTMSQPMFNDPKNPAKDSSKRCYNLMNHTAAIRRGGMLFRYEKAPDLLCAMIKNITGKEFIAYLRPIFDAIGVSEDIWCVKTAEDYCWGGSGIVTTLRDFAKMGEFLMNKGRVNGKQLIDRDYMEKATTVRIANLSANNYNPLTSGGYGYYTWLTPDAVCFRGMGSQQCYCFMDKNFLFVCQSDTQVDNDRASEWIYDCVKHLVYDKIGRKKKEGSAYLQLQEALQNMQPPMYGVPHSAWEKEINSKEYILNEGNPLGWKNFRFDFAPNGTEGTFTYENRRGVKTISFGMGKLKCGTFPETHYYDRKLTVPANRELNCTAVCEWIEEKKLQLRVYVTDTCFANLFVTFAFKGKDVAFTANRKAEYFMEDYAGDGNGYVRE